ncbi:glycosyltransferase family 4 protein, partial [Streptococcus suis]
SLAYGVKPITVPHPVNQARFGRGQRVRDYDDTRLTIVFLGRLEARKGVHTLIEAYRALNAEVRTKARLVIAGYGPELPRAQRKSAGDSDITFTGYVNEHDKPNILASADIAVFP